MNLEKFVGKRVLVHSENGLVVIGILKERNDNEVYLTDAINIYYWKKALSIFDVAQTGVDFKESKISVKVEAIIIPNALEIILVNEKIWK